MSLLSSELSWRVYAIERMAISLLKDLPFANTFSSLVDVGSISAGFSTGGSMLPANCDGGRAVVGGCVAVMPMKDSGGWVLGRK